LLGGSLTLWVGAAALAGSASRLTYTKVLKGSVPEYMHLVVDADGKATYDGRKLADPPNPRSFEISRATTERLFSLSQSLGYFRSLTLESRHKVANMGLKTLTYEAAGQVSRVEYNYTENHTADELSQLFEKISAIEEHIAQLDYEIKYDPLSLPQQLRQIQMEMNDNELAEAKLLVPTLEKITSNPRFLHLAQIRAQDILTRIRENN
jgi:hypothetical protein